MKLYEVTGHFRAGWTIPDEKGNIKLSPLVTSLVNCPRHIKGDLNMLHAQITSLRELRNMTDLVVEGIVWFNPHKIKDPLNFLFVPGIKTVTSGVLSPAPGLGRTITRFLQSENRDILACQQYMIDEGYAEWARI